MLTLLISVGLLALAIMAGMWGYNKLLKPCGCAEKKLS